MELKNKTHILLSKLGQIWYTSHIPLLVFSSCCFHYSHTLKRTLNPLIPFHVRSIPHWLTISCFVSSVSLLQRAFEMSVNIDFIYLIDIARADTGTLHKQWRNALETPGDEQKKGVGVRGERSFLAPTLIPCQPIGRRSLSTLELECLSFTHQTICFIRFIFSPSDPAQPDKALMMKRRGHPCIISELPCKKVCVCARARTCVPVSLQQYKFGRARVQTVMPTNSQHLFWPEDWPSPFLTLPSCPTQE